jgi:aromatic ring-cleaving dioxygenase
MEGRPVNTPDDTTAATWALFRHSPASWDVHPATLDPHDHADWVIARILQIGQWSDWLALFRLYPPARIQRALDHRRVFPHVRSFWQTYFAEQEGALFNPTRWIRPPRRCGGSWAPHCAPRAICWAAKPLWPCI